MLGVQCNHWPRATLTIDPELAPGETRCPCSPPPPGYPKSEGHQDDQKDRVGIGCQRTCPTDRK